MLVDIGLILPFLFLMTALFAEFIPSKIETEMNLGKLKANILAFFMGNNLRASGYWSAGLICISMFVKVSISLPKQFLTGLFLAEGFHFLFM